MQITSLALVAGTPTHVTVADGSTTPPTPLPPASITWAAVGGANVNMITSDATGFNFLANAPLTGAFVATYHNGSVSVPAASLNVTATASVEPIYLSP